MNKTIGYVAIVIVVVVLLAIYFSSGNSPTTGQSQSQTPQPTSSTASVTTTLKTVSQGGVASPLFHLPDAKTSEAEKMKYFQLVNKAAEGAEYITLGKCEVTPLVFRTKLKQSFVFQNKDVVPHTLKIASTTVKVPANGKTSVQADFGHGFGVEGYTCDNLPGGLVGNGLIGLILIVP